MKMNAYSVAAIVLIVAGILGLVYSQFTYTTESEGASLGPLELTVNEKKTVNIPVWAGVGAIVAGAGMLVFPFIKR
jgi:hypothetical protein